MATPTIPNGKDYFNVVNYSGTGSDNAVTGVGFAPDSTWLKRRDSGLADWGVFDTSRGVTKNLKFNKTDAETTEVNSLKTFGTDGFTVGSSGDYNASGGTFSSFNFLANGGTTESISAGGDIDIASVVQKNTTAGFSIVQYTGNGNSTDGQGVGHGLSVAPRWIIVKELSSTDNWNVWHGTFGNEKILLDSDGAKFSSTAFGNFTPSSTIFKVRGSNTNASSTTYVAYCWNEIPGYSKFSSYTGNGSTSGDGTFVYLGFTAQFIMIKETGNSNDWMIWDNARFPLNPTNNSLFANLPQGDNSSSIDLDVLSNGFKCRTNNSQINRSSGSYIFCAFASNPFVGDGTNPVTAR